MRMRLMPLQAPVGMTAAAVPLLRPQLPADRHVMWVQRRRTGFAPQLARGRLTSIIATASSRRPRAAAHPTVHGSSGGTSLQRAGTGTGRGSSRASTRRLGGDRGGRVCAQRADADTGRPTQTAVGGRGGSAAQQNGGRGGGSSAARQQANLDLLLSLGQQFTSESLPWIQDLLVPLLTLGRPAPPLTGMNELRCEL